MTHKTSYSSDGADGTGNETLPLDVINIESRFDVVRSDHL
jgi:hypothetical protein